MSDVLLKILFSCYFLARVLNAQWIDTKRLLELQAKAANLNFPCGPVRYNYSLNHNQTTVDNLIAIYNCSSLDLNNNPDILNNTYDLFNNNFYITDLILSNNRLSRFIYSQRINFYDSLRLLDLSENLLSEDVTVDLNQLDCNLLDYFKVLILANNRFKRIPELSVACMRQVESLDMSFNRLIRNLDFVGNVSNYTRLRSLDLRYCSIEYLLDVSTLRNMPNLVELNLAFNQIKTIQPNPFALLTRLQFIDLDSNQLSCDENLLWFKGYLVQTRLRWLQNRTSIYRPLCFNVLTDKNESIVDLNDVLFYSAIQLSTTQSSNIFALDGQSIKLTCVVFSRPESFITWLFNHRFLDFTFDNNFFQIEESNVNGTMFNKTSSLHLFNVSSHLNGNYTCTANYKLPNSSNTINSSLSKSLTFRVQVSPKLNTAKLTTAELVGIIVGSIIGLLLILFLLFIIIYFICYKKRLCCFKNAKLKSSSTKYLNKGSVTTSSSRVEFDNDDDEYDTNEKPNYIINTISKANGSAYAKNDTQPSSRDVDEDGQLDFSGSGGARFPQENVDSQFYFSNNANFTKYQQSQINKPSLLPYSLQQQYTIGSNNKIIKYDSDV